MIKDSTVDLRKIKRETKNNIKEEAVKEAVAELDEAVKKEEEKLKEKKKEIRKKILSAQGKAEMKIIHEARKGFLEDRKKAQKRWLEDAKSKFSELTPKQRKFVKEYVENKGNATQAALAAYDVAEKNASRVGHEVKNNPKVAYAIEVAFREAGLDEDYVAGLLKDVMESGRQNLDKTRPTDVLKALDMFTDLSKMKGDDSTKNAREQLEDQLMKKSVVDLKKELKELDRQQKKIMGLLDGSIQEGEILDDEDTQD